MVSAANNYDPSKDSFVLVHDNSVGPLPPRGKFLNLDSAILIFSNLNFSDLNSAGRVCKQWKHLFGKILQSHLGNNLAESKVKSYLFLARRMNAHIFLRTPSQNAKPALYFHADRKVVTYAEENKITDNKNIRLDIPKSAAVFENGSWIVASPGLISEFISATEERYINFPPNDCKIIELKSEGNVVVGLQEDRKKLVMIERTKNSIHLLSWIHPISSFEIEDGKAYIAYSDGTVDCHKVYEGKTSLFAKGGKSPVTAMKSHYGSLFMGMENGQLSVYNSEKDKFSFHFGTIHSAAIVSIAVQDCFVFSLSSFDKGSTITCHNKFNGFKIAHMNLEPVSRIFYGEGTLALVMNNAKKNFEFLDYGSKDAKAVNQDESKALPKEPPKPQSEPARPSGSSQSFPKKLVSNVKSLLGGKN